MKKFLIFIVVLALAFLGYKLVFKKNKDAGEKPVPVAVGKPTAAFDQSVDVVLTSYYTLTDGFVNWDTAIVTTTAATLETALGHLKVDETQKDTVIYQTVLSTLDLAKINVATIKGSHDWTERRHALNDLSDNIRTILLAVKYDKAPVYWQECPMAFGEGQSGNWLSAKDAIVNPYLGNKDPKFGKTMLNCGETKMTIDFTKTDSTQVK
ncbi:MAG: DUF3347 domain-containing protein [Niabella sp.]|nr:DUF3347 domain-containing protein [Niabella sp.]